MYRVRTYIRTSKDVFDTCFSSSSLSGAGRAEVTRKRKEETDGGSRENGRIDQRVPVVKSSGVKFWKR